MLYIHTRYIASWIIGRPRCEIELGFWCRTRLKEMEGHRMTGEPSSLDDRHKCDEEEEDFCIIIYRPIE